MKKIMNPKNVLALGIVLVLMATVFLPMFSTYAISDSKDAKTVGISVIPNTNTTKSRSPGYAVYNLTVNTSSPGLSYIDFTATNISVWTVEFLNESGVPLPTVSSGKPGISSPIQNKNYYVLTKVKVPSGIGNGTQQNHTVYVNESSGGFKAVVLKTICDTFSTPSPHAIVGTAKYPSTGENADGALALLINTVTGETSYDTVGTTGVSSVSGNYSTDTSQMPSGCTNNTWLQVIISNTTSNKYGTLKIQMNNATAFQWANVTLNITGFVVAGASPSSAKAAKTADGLSVNLTWENTGATEYLIYRSPYLNGTGFGATPVNKTSNTWYVDSGAYASSSNYSYVVNATGNTTKSNIAFKLCMGIIKPKAPNLNWVSLPYNCPYANIKELAEAVNPGGADANVSEVRYWDAANQLYMIATYDEIEGWGGASYPVTPGMAVMLAAKTTQTWKIVGSHNKSTVINILKPNAPNLNWVALPYHCSYANIKALAEAVNPGGADANVSEVRYWDAANQLYMIATYDEIEGWGGASYPVTPGMAVMLAAKTTQTWVPAANNP